MDGLSLSAYSDSKSTSTVQYIYDKTIRTTERKEMVREVKYFLGVLWCAISRREASLEFQKNKKIR
jgi:hypothetical protein